MQFNTDGEQLDRVQLPESIDPTYAVESPTGTFIVSHNKLQVNGDWVSEVDTEGKVLCQFGRTEPGCTEHIAVDSHGNILVTNYDNYRILLLDAQLVLHHVIIDELQLNDKPRRLCYIEQSGQLLVGLDKSVEVFKVK